MTWSERLKTLIESNVTFPSELGEYADANVDAITGAIEGRGPDASKPDDGAGARMAVNISSVHMPALCQRDPKGSLMPYKNCYDLGRYKKYRIGSHPPETAPTRVLVDSALPVAPATAKDIYFGAVELNGVGIRFYGDVCLILNSDQPGLGAIVLASNSYDLARSPLREKITGHAKPQAARQYFARKMSGTWMVDLPHMAAHKIFETYGFRARRLTTGQISAAICDDEDYIEVLKIGSFTVDELQEARFSSAEAAQDSLAADRLATGPTPRMESLVFRERRARAEEALRKLNVNTLVHTTNGRVKS